MNPKFVVLCDMDGTLISAEDKPRPYIEEFLRTVRERNGLMVVQSAGGKLYAKSKLSSLLAKLELTDYIECFGKHEIKDSKVPVFVLDDEEAVILEWTRRHVRNDGYHIPFYTGEPDEELKFAAAYIEEWLDHVADDDHDSLDDDDSHDDDDWSDNDGEHDDDDEEVEDES